MTKHFVAVALAATVWVPGAASQSILQRSDWRGANFETYLPSPPSSVPWLNRNTRTRLPKGDLPIGREPSSVGPLLLQAMTPSTQVSSNSPSEWRRM
jgi:hypothetical protein